MIKRIKTNNKIITKGSLSRLVDKIIQHDTGTITSFRSQYNLEDNKKRNRSLNANLLSLGYRITKVKGGFIENIGEEDEKEVDEDVFFVEDWKDRGRLKEDLISLGEKFDQDSILFIPKSNIEDVKVGDVSSFLIGTSRDDNKELKYGEEIKFPVLKLGKGDNQFITKIKGRPFYFKECLNEYECSGNLSRYAHLTIAKRDWKDL